MWNSNYVDTLASSHFPWTSVSGATDLPEDLKRRKYVGLDRANTFALLEVEILGVPRLFESW